jgi:cell division protein FtsL
MENKKSFFMLLVVVGLIAAAVGLVLPMHKAHQVRDLSEQMLSHWQAHENGNGTQALQEYSNAGALRDQRESQLRKLTDRAHTTALVGLLLAACGLIGLWSCTNRELKNMQDAQQPPAR